MAESETLENPQPSAMDQDANKNQDQSTPDALNPSGGSHFHSDSDSDSKSASDSDSDSDSEEEAQVDERIEALGKLLENNPLDYDSHVQYIQILRKQGNIEKLRQARETMSSSFPLTPEMWQEWAKDETTITSGEDTLPTVEKLYERGVSDYLSVDLWCDYLNFVQKHDPSVHKCSASGISKARNLFERALTATGLHFAEGHRIWEAYREFEQDIFLTIAKTDSGAKEKQIQRIRNLFHRQMSIPLADLKSTLLKYKAWEAEHGNSTDVNGGELDGLSSHVVSLYQKALEMMNARACLEEKISKKEVDPEKLQDYMTYLKFEHSYGDPARIQILYERAIADFPVSADLWTDYTQYLDKTFKTSKIGRDAYYRATRNCPWIGELWVRYLLALERSRGTEEELSTVFERALQCTFSSYDEYLNIFLTRVDGLRRKMSASKQTEDGMDYAVIRDIFQRASDYFSAYLNNADSLLRIYSYWARLELCLGKDLSAARGVWESLLKISGSLIEVWQAYIAWEIETGHINEARSLYKRCYSKRFPGTGSEDICHLWVRFEREYGSLEDFDLAMQKVTPRLQELQLFRLQQEEKIAGPPTNESENSSGKNTRQKRKPTSNLINEQSPEKRRKNMTQEKTNNENKSHARSSAGASKAAELDENEVHPAGNQEKMEKSSKKPLPFDDQCTAFISNLNFKATDDDLRKFFADVGGVVAVRILKDKFTRKSRGLAYVDFSDDAHLEAAVEKNKQMFMGKRLSVLKSDPQQGRKKRSIGSEHGKKDSQEDSEGKTESKPESFRFKQDKNVELKNTFAVPRNVKPLGWISRNKPKSEEDAQQEDGTPKSNDEFRKMFIEK